MQTKHHEEIPELDFTPKPISAKQTIKLTIALLAGAGGLLTLLWLIVQSK